MAIGYSNYHQHNYGLSPDSSPINDYRTGTWATSSSTTSSCSESTRPMTATEIKEYAERERFSERPGFRTADEWEKYYGVMKKQPMMEEPRAARLEEANVPPKKEYRAMYGADFGLRSGSLRVNQSIGMTVEDRNRKYKIEPGQEDYYRGLFQYYKAIVGDQMLCYDIDYMPVKEAIEFMKSKLYDK